MSVFSYYHFTSTYGSLTAQADRLPWLAIPIWLAAGPSPGLSKNQIRRLFPGHVENYGIDAALENLVALGALTVRSEPGAGRSSSLWSAIAEQEQEEEEGSVAEEDQPAAQEEGA
jgi:hypothetical protein